MTRMSACWKSTAVELAAETVVVVVETVVTVVTGLEPPMLLRLAGFRSVTARLCFTPSASGSGVTSIVALLLLLDASLTFMFAVCEPLVLTLML